MQPTIRIDTSRWQRAAIELQKTSSRSMVDFINGQALRVAIQSVRETEKANKSEIERVLGATGRIVSFKEVTRGKNKGQIRTKRGRYDSKDDSFAARILLARKRETGSFGIKGDTMAERVSNFIRARIAAVNFIAAGWIPARNILWSAVKNKQGIAGSVAGVKKRGVDKGTARPATFSLRSEIVSIIQNSALMKNQGKSPATGGDPVSIARSGLQKALNFATLDMERKLAERLNPDIRKFNRS